MSYPMQSSRFFRVLLVAILIFSTSCSFADEKPQEPPSIINYSTPVTSIIAFDDVHWQEFTLDFFVNSDSVGQESSGISQIELSPNGTLWAAGLSGLFRFENNAWVPIQWPDELTGVNSIAIAPNGDVWLGAWEGAYRYDGKTWQVFPEYMVHEVSIGPDGIVWISYLVPGPEDTAVGGYEGVSWFDGKTWHTLIDDTNDIGVMHVANSPDGTVWFGTHSSGIFSFMNKSWVHYPIDEFPNYPESGGIYECSQCVRALDISPDGSLWAVVVTAGLVHKDGQNWSTFPFYTDSPGIVIEVNAEDRVWIGGSREYGLVYWDDGQWYAVSETPFNIVYDINIEQDRAVWFATDQGLYRYWE